MAKNKEKNFEEALSCFNKAYEIEKDSNNYDGIYYTASHIAKILLKQKPKKALEYLIEAKRSADFLNEEFYMLESSLALGDYYYYNPKNYSEALKEYFKALQIAENSSFTIDKSKIENRITYFIITLGIFLLIKIFPLSLKDIKCLSNSES